MSCVMNTTVSSSAGSIQNAVLAMPPQLNSPSLAMTFDAAASAGEPLRRSLVAFAEGVVAHRIGQAGRHRVQRSEPLVPGLVDVERGVGHVQRSEDVLVEELVQRLAGHDLDESPENVGGDRVVPLGAGLERQRKARD